nr:hypothetical protein [Tanacetum cinerariifolium]
MTNVNQGMSVEEIKRVVAQRVANAIEAIAIYETKTNLARKLMSQTKRQKEKVVENASNKRKWEGNHNGSSSQQNNGHKVPRAHTAWQINKKAYAGSLPLCNQCKFHHNGPYTVKCRNYKKRLDNTYKKNQNQQPPNKKQNTGRVYTAKHGEKKHYGGSKPLFSKCYYHHDGPCKVNAECYREEGDGMQHFEDLGKRKFGFDAIIGMDWLRRHHVMTVCDDKLIFATRKDDKPEGKQVKDVPIVQEFPKVFSENLPGLSPARPVKIPDRSNSRSCTCGPRAIPLSFI